MTAAAWRSFADHVREVHGPGVRVHKITLDAGFTCPNIDGTVARGGCTYCNNRSFSPPTRRPRRSLTEQVAAGIDFYRRRRGPSEYYAYFQAWTNTHAPVERLRALYDEALGAAGFLGLDIGTRPDCAGEDVLDLVSSYADRYEVWIEYGLQSMHDATARATNRGHGLDAFVDAVERTARRPIRVCAHLIHGLPGETPEMMLETARTVAALPIDGIKIHHCYVARGTALAALHAAGGFRPIGLDEYLDILIATLEVLPPGVVVHRLVGEFPGGETLAPDWGIARGTFFDRLRRELADRRTRQGARSRAS